MGDGMLVRVKTRAGDGPCVEAVNLETEEVLGPAIVANQYGRGSAIYVGGSLEGHYAASRVLSLQKMPVSMARYLASDAPLPFMLEAPQGAYGVRGKRRRGT